MDGSIPVAMVIEDDPDAAEVASGMLAMLGFEVEHCADAHQALYALAERPPSLILLDICQPEMDGVNLLKVARRVAEARDVPVIAASALYPQGGAIARSLKELGVEVFMSKPFTLEGLKKAVGRVMPMHRIKAKAPPPLSTTGKIEGIAKVSGADVTVEVVGGDDYNLEVLSTSSPLPSGQSLTLTITRREIFDDKAQDSEILVLASVRSTAQAAIGWKSHLDVKAARPQDAFDRMAKALAAR